ncbi:MAG: site-2 protease family protein [Planctomycetes bacterium]|nr:site-2 protease family protein [Planctomycetota bacterium]
MRDILAPLFLEVREVEFRNGLIFHGWASPYCEEHRAEVERGLRQLPGGFCFETLEGRPYLTYTMPGPLAKPVNWPLHALLLAATVLTTLVAGAGWRFDSFLEAFAGSLLGAPGSMPLPELMAALVAEGGQFSLAILLILGSHECGHYLMARRYGMLVTPPFFLPAPIPPIGTFGAVIRLRSPMLHRRALLDVGLAGPLAGLAVALPFLIYGILHTKGTYPEAFAVVKDWQQGGSVVFGDSLLTWGLTRLLLGVPPAGHAVDWLSHPFAWAGWIGLLVTALNLVPVGQLDGGHVAYALVGRRQRHVALFFLGVLIALSGKWRGWLFWAVIMALLVRVAHPPVVIEGVPLGMGRKILGWAAAAIFLLVFMPAPVRGIF